MTFVRVSSETFMTFPGYDPKKGDVNGSVFACTKFLCLTRTQINDFSSAHTEFVT